MAEVNAVADLPQPQRSSHFQQPEHRVPRSNDHEEDAEQGNPQYVKGLVQEENLSAEAGEGNEGCRLALRHLDAPLALPPINREDSAEKSCRDLELNVVHIAEQHNEPKRGKFHPCRILFQKHYDQQWERNVKPCFV